MHSVTYGDNSPLMEKHKFLCCLKWQEMSSPVNTKHCGNVVIMLQCTTIHNVVAMLMSQRQNYNVSTMLFQRWILSLTHSVLRILYWQHCCNIEMATSNSQLLHKSSSTMSNSQRCTNVALELDRWLQWHKDVVTKSKFTTSSQRQHYDVASALRRMDYSKSRGNISTTLPHSCQNV